LLAKLPAGLYVTGHSIVNSFFEDTSPKVSLANGLFQLNIKSNQSENATNLFWGRIHKLGFAKYFKQQPFSVHFWLDATRSKQKKCKGNRGRMQSNRHIHLCFISLVTSVCSGGTRANFELLCVLSSAVNQLFAFFIKF